jgi:hypothetical protein
MAKMTNLEKRKGLKISGTHKQFGAPDRFNKEPAAALSRREQRKLDQAQGLIPFAVKLDSGLVKRVHALAQARQTGVNEIIAELLEKGLAG